MASVYINTSVRTSCHRMHAYMCTYTYVHNIWIHYTYHIYICMYCTYMHACIHTYIHTYMRRERERERGRERERERERETETESQVHVTDSYVCTYMKIIGAVGSGFNRRLLTCVSSGDCLEEIFHNGIALGFITTMT